ncbi:hypothetical protein GCM10009608_06960 [Pseudonocardia alaniniphila]
MPNQSETQEFFPTGTQRVITEIVSPTQMFRVAPENPGSDIVERTSNQGTSGLAELAPSNGMTTTTNLFTSVGAVPRTTAG